MSKKKYVVIITFTHNGGFDILRVDLFDTLDEARKFATKVENDPILNKVQDSILTLYGPYLELHTNVMIIELEPTNADIALKKFRSEFPKSNLTAAY